MRFIVIRLKYVFFALLAAVLVTVVVLTPKLSVTTFLSGGRELPVYSVERGDNKIALTFDCAWGAEDIDAIAAAFESRHVKATFFVTGKWAEENSAAVNKLYRGGHEIGIHSYNHDDYTKMTAARITEDIEKCSAIIRGITGTEPTLVRAPSGAYNDTVIKAVEDGGRMCIQWSVDGLDYTDIAEDEIYTRVVSGTESGSIILLHSGTAHTADILPRILDSLGNYELVTVSELVYHDNFTLDGTGRQIKHEIY